MRRAREECQPKVIYLDDNSSISGAQPADYTTLFMFEDDGSVVKVQQYLPLWFNLLVYVLLLTLSLSGIEVSPSGLLASARRGKDCASSLHYCLKLASSTQRYRRFRSS